MKRLSLLFICTITFLFILISCKPNPVGDKDYTITYLVRYPDEATFYTYKAVLYNTSNTFYLEPLLESDGYYNFVGWSLNPDGDIIDNLTITSNTNLYGWYSLELPELVDDISYVLSWMELNYSYYFETGWTYGDFQVTEYGVFDSISSNPAYPNALIRDYRDLMHYGYLNGTNISFFRGDELEFPSYNALYNLSDFNEDNIYNQLIIDDSETFVSIEIIGTFNDDGSFTFEKNIASFFAYLILGDELGYCSRVEIVLEDDVLTVYGITRESYSFLELPGVSSPSGSGVIFEADFTNVGSTSIGAFEEFFLSNTLPIYGTLGNWDDILTTLNEQMYVVLDSDIEEIFTSIVSVLPIIAGELDFDYYSEADSLYYFSRVTIGIFNKTEQDLATFVQQAYPLSLGIDDVWGLFLINTPVKVYLLPSFNQYDQTLVMTFYFQHYSLWPELEVNDLIHNTFEDIDIPVLTGAVRYYFSSNFSGNYVVAYLEENQNPGVMVETWIAYLQTYHGYLRVMTNQGEQIQDPTRRIALYFQTFNDFGPEIMIDFMLASPGADMDWPVAALDEHGINIIPVCDGEYYTFSYQTVINAYMISVLNPQVGFMEYQAILTSLGYTRVFEDPAWATMYSFLAPDHIHQVTITNRTYEDQYWITIYDRISNPLTFTSYIPSSLASSIGANYLDIPFATGDSASYSLVNTYLIFGQGLEEVPAGLRYNVWGIYSTGLTTQDVTNFYDNFISGGWSLGKFNMYYSSQYPGLGINYIDFLDGSILVGGANYYYSYDDPNDAIAAAIEAFILRFPAYTTQITDIASSLPLLTNEAYETIITFLTGSLTTGSDQMEIMITGISAIDALNFKNELFASYTFQPASSYRYEGSLWVQRGFVNISGSNTWFDITIAYYNNTLYIYIRS